MASVSRWLQARVPLLLAGLALAAVVLMVLVLTGRPIATEDFWFHLKMGEVYVHQGPWPQADPMLHTAGALRPVQHEWLFGVLMYGLDRGVGLQGLRVIHVLWVSGILVLAHAIARRQARAALPALLCTLVFCVVSFSRLVQLRPDLCTILATLLLYRLLWQDPGVPSRGRLVAATFIFLLWVNFHSLFGVGLALLCAALCGAWIEGTMAQEFAPDAAPPADQRLDRRLLVALLAAVLVTLLNPRGVRQHLTFFLSSHNSAIWTIDDEWHPFYPFALSYPHNSVSLYLLPWLLTDLLFVLFTAVFLYQYRRFRARPGSATLAALAPRLFLPAAASLGAILISSRFLWLGIFPLLYVLHALGAAREEAGEAPDAPLSWAWAAPLTGAALAIAAAFMPASGWMVQISDTPLFPAAYLHMAYNSRRYADPGVHFLRDSGVQGNLYNPYGLGGYLGYRLAPRVRTFIDGRTEHYPAEVMEDYQRIADPGTPAAERLALLDQRRVDIFFAYGGEASRYRRQDTLHLLDGAPGWVLVYRSLDHAIYLRRDADDAENLRRVAAYYEERHIPFDPQRGFQVDAAIHAQPGWATAQGLLPSYYGDLLALSHSGPPAARYQALHQLARIYHTIGDENDRRAAEQAAEQVRATATAAP